MTNDYASDPRLCLSAVSFLPKELQTAIIERIVAPLRRLDPNQYFYLPESLHLTIQNIRKIDDKHTFGTKEIELAKIACRKILPSINNFDFELKGVLGLSTSISVCCFSDETIGTLTALLREELCDLGIPDDKRYVSDEAVLGNITICRYTQQPSKPLLDQLENMRDVAIGVLPIHEVSLIQANSVCYPSSTRIFAEYTLIRGSTCAQ